MASGLPYAPNGRRSVALYHHIRSLFPLGYPASERLEIIQLVGQSHPPVRRTLQTPGVSRAVFFADGAKFLFEGRCMFDCDDLYSNFVQGSKGMGIISKSGDCGAPSSIYKGQLPKPSNLLWQSKTKPEELNPYQNEWNDFVAAIRNDKPYNEARRGIEASLVTAMGRRAAHTGKEITFDDMLKCEYEFAPNVDKLTMDGPAPVQADANGKYPVPMPGITTKQEY